jgi:hypothetical protein
MNEKTKPPAAEIFEQAMKQYEQALKTGLKLQEESGRMFTSLLNEASSAEEWQKRASTLSKEIIPAAQKRMNECVKLVEESSRTSLELLRKAMDASLVPPGQESQAKWVDFWEASLGTLRDNAKAVSEINNGVVDAWGAFLRKSSEFAAPKPKHQT